MFKRKIIYVLAIISCFAMTIYIQARPLTFYNYVTHFEVTRLNEIIWFWSPDTLYGWTHSNDYIGMRYTPHFYGPISTSQDRFRYDRANPYFEYEPIFNAPPVYFPRSYPHLRERANPFIDGHGGHYMTRIHLRGGDGIQIFQRRIGVGAQDTLIETLRAPDRQIIFVDGEVEVHGVLAGALTIASAGDMWLIDNVRYEGADRRTGWFEEEEMPHMLGLVSEGNIIIKNDTLNGRGDGYNRAPDDINQHSIIINAALIALGESFTFEHQNDENDAFQGPTPDNRGYIHLKGSQAQYRKGYVHRFNHIGTGYGTNYRYDYRLRHWGPPGFAPPDIEGNYDHLDIRYSSTVRNAVVNTLVIHQGVEIILDGHTPLTVHDRLVINGTTEHPVTFRNRSPGSRSCIRVSPGRSHVQMEHAQFGSGIELWFELDSLAAKNCDVDGPVHWEGHISVDSTIFTDDVELASWGRIQVERCVFESGVTISGDVRDGSLTNNTIVGSRGAGVEINRFNRLRLTNNIIAFNRQGIVNDHYEQPVLEYNDVYGNRDDDYVNCQGGEGSISDDPLFVDRNRGDYQLGWGSPCIDAGDPDSPLDPDGSRADIGAFSFHHQLGLKPDVEPAGEFQVLVMPNPFNRSASLFIQAPQAGTMKIAVYNIRGQMLVSQEIRIEGGSQRIELDGEVFYIPGIYLARVSIENNRQDLKLVYLP